MPGRGLLTDPLAALVGALYIIAHELTGFELSADAIGAIIIVVASVRGVVESRKARKVEEALSQSRSDAKASSA